ncbi:MAG: isoleucine--tRNA ligase [Pirellulaceae bacterium]|nr:isoleucine--tRNA ligase [Pirellulaceae bacterium]
MKASQDSLSSAFKAVGSDVRFPEQEEAILQFWREHDIYRRSLELRADGPSFVFFEGPPTANGMPHPGHCLTRAIKDLFPRYRTMRGYRCLRKAGWDTHGLPVEVEVCKELGIHSKSEIEAFGIEPFIQKCQQSVWRYMKEWERLTERIGFWIDLSEAYVTYHQSYVESIWWSLKNLFERGLLYRGHKIVWWWAQGGTALSSGEVGQGYREVADPSVFVRFPLEDEPNVSLVVWTTTPWTLPSNQFAAVNPKLNYAYCREADSNETLILAEGLVASLAEKTKRPLTIEKIVPGSALVGRAYEPPFDYYYRATRSNAGRLKDGGNQRHAWRIVAADFVTLDAGTGAVHIAPAFGEVDYEVLMQERLRFVTGEAPELICAVDSEGKFTSEAADYTGIWVKDTDKLITRRLRENSRLWHQEQYVHDYPFCWRAESDPLIQYPRESWFIRTTKFRDAMLANNAKIGWSPDHIRDGRFGNFLSSNVDWALSRERYWGTPLPIWVCESTGQMEAIESYEELLAKPGCAGMDVWAKAKAANPDLVDDLKVHKPYIDAITYQSPFAADARMRRVSEVIDCWYDSGAMPFAQWGYPHKNKEAFRDQFPADFISEAIDQTRGWFYSQLAISTMLFSSPDGEAATATKTPQSSTQSLDYPHPFRNCIVLGLMLAEWYESKDGKQRFLVEEEAKAACGQDYVSKTGKMSKQLRNYRSPQEIFDRFGADALRWYFYANQPPWNSILYSERAIRDSIPEFMLRLWNVFSFFTIYAELDGFSGPGEIEGPLDQLTSEELSKAKTYRPHSERSELDRWILGEVASAVSEVIAKMDAYDSYGACQVLSQLVEGLSNWYVRRSRNRYWAADKTSPEKLDAYWTLYECLLSITKMIAPFVPFLAESLWQHLSKPVVGRVRESIHLCNFPSPETSIIDPTLAASMSVLREIASLGRSARMEAKLKVRQPLARVEVTLSNAEHAAWLKAHDDIVREELNVKEIHYAGGSNPYIEYLVQPNFRSLGPRVGAKLPKVKAALGKADGAALMREMTANGKIELSIDGETLLLDDQDIQVRLQAKSGWAAAQGKACVVVLATELTDELIAEGVARDAIRLIQDLRKTRGCRFADRIKVFVLCEDDKVRHAIQGFLDYIAAETLAVSIEWVMQEPVEVEMQAVELADSQVKIGLQVA